MPFRFAVRGGSIRILLKFPTFLVVLCLTSLVGCTKAMEGNGNVYGGIPLATQKSQLAHAQVREAVQNLRRGIARSTFCDSKCHDRLDRSVCDVIERAGPIKLELAQKLVIDSLEPLNALVSRPFAELIRIEESGVVVNGSRVAMRTEYSESGPVYAGMQEVLQLTSGLLRMALGHELFHKIRWALERTATTVADFLRDDASIAYRGITVRGSDLATLAGACLTDYAEEHNRWADSFAFLARGSGKVFDVRFDRLTLATTITERAGFSPSPQLFGLKSVDASPVPYYAGSWCRNIHDSSGNVTSTRCPNAVTVDSAQKEGTDYLLTADGRLLAQRGNSVSEIDHRLPLRSIARVAEERAELWYLLLADGSIVYTPDIHETGYYSEVIGLRLPQALRLVSGPGASPP